MYIVIVTANSECGVVNIEFDIQLGKDSSTALKYKDIYNK